MTEQTKAAENISDYIFENVLFESDRMARSVELRAVVTDLDIYEHLDKPYLTAAISFTDNKNFLSGVDILGAEKITVRIKSLRNNTFSIEKKFYIDKVLINQKVNDNTQFISLHLIEDIGFISNLYNVNRVYTGKCTEIIQKISSNYLNKEVYSSDNDKQSIKVIVPNLNPIEAMSWIKNRATTIDGYPFYLYSTFVGEKLKFADLGTLLTQGVLNEDIPYRYYQGASQTSDRDVQRRTIMQYTQEDTEDLFDLISKGLIGGDYEYIDTIKNKKNSFHFDVTKDLLQPIVQKNVLPRTQSNVMYSPDYVHNERSLNTLPSRLISQIGGASVYDSGSAKYRSYSESDIVSDYKLNIISKAMDEFLKKAPMQLVLNGIDFIDGDVNTATGNKIRVLFLDSDPEASIEDDRIDPKKSGDYLVFATQHMFKREKYDVRMTCVKLGNYKR